MLPEADQQTPSRAIVVYDGDCPFCSRYVTLLRLRESLGTVQLINARDSDDPLVHRLRAEGIDLDEGMVLKLGDQLYHGADCINRLAMLSTPVNLFNRLNAGIFRSPTASAVLYPALRAGRGLVLRLLGRGRIGALPADRDA
jgi:predicted DCC family thiol-disulfide oxidoreductase YuxK